MHPGAAPPSMRHSPLPRLRLKQGDVTPPSIRPPRRWSGTGVFMLMTAVTLVLGGAIYLWLDSEPSTATGEPVASTAEPAESPPAPPDPDEGSDIPDMVISESELAEPQPTPVIEPEAPVSVAVRSEPPGARVILRGKVQVDKLQRKNVTKSDLGKVEHSARDVFGEDIAGKRSQGIQVDDRVLRQESHGLAAYSGVAVEADQYSDFPGGSSLSYLSGQAGRRDMENIRRTFEAAKSSVYSLYLQSLHEHPELAGKFIFRLIIEPDGSISDLQLVSSELGLRDLESTILGRIRNINFGAQDVSPTAVEYAFSFLPS
jgi:hypothetical protein